MPSGTAAYDWTVNDEWNVRDAWIADATGRRVVDFQEHNLHLVGYSVPVRARMSMDELRPHLHTLPEHPDWIPYRTTYYHRTWGFCLTQRQLEAMGEGPFDVVVDTTLEPGELTYGELAIPGETAEEVLFTAHVCHPSLANDNLSGIVVAVELARALAALPSRRFSYRFLFAPGTIGSITWLSRNRPLLDRDPARAGAHRPRRPRAAGLQADPSWGPDDRPGGGPCGDPQRRGGPGLLAVRLRRAAVQRARASTSRSAGSRAPRTASTPSTTPPPTTSTSSRTRSCWMRTPRCWRIVEVLENDAAYLNLSPYGEPQLGKRGLYPTTGGKSASDAVMAMLWTLGVLRRHAPRCWTSPTGPTSTSPRCAARRPISPVPAWLERAGEQPGR